MKQSIVFFGTGPVSLATLEGIHESFTIEAIITKPDRISPSGKAHEHPVRAWGEKHNTPVHQVATKKALNELFKSTHFTSDAGLVVDFGMIIPGSVIDSFAKGIVNSHFSLLPRLRGADPITFAILEGHKETGVSLMTIVEALDEGDLIVQERYELSLTITTPELTDALVKLSNLSLQEYLPKYLIDDIKLRPQDTSPLPTYTRKLTKADGNIDWRKSADQIEREIRAFIGWPGSRAEIKGKDVIVTQAAVTNDKNDGDLVMRCGKNSFLRIEKLKPAGKREMNASDFLRGLN